MPIEVIPAPARVDSPGGEPFVLDDSVRIVFLLEELRSVAKRFAADIEGQSGIRLSLAEAGGANQEATIFLELATDAAEWDELPGTVGARADDGDAEGERYRLRIEQGEVRIRATAPEGIHRGLTTLRQLIGTRQPVTLPPVDILDAPRFAWRGLTLDTARTFWSVDQVRQVIDLLTLYKFNVLHLHLTDSEGWRIEIESWPKLTGIGGQGAAANRPGGFYTKREFADLVVYAAERFITIVPEIEMPGHTGAVFRAYPELSGDGSGGEEELSQPAMLQWFHPDHPRVFGFITDVLTEVAALTPGAYLHIGGDEAFGMDDELYQRFMSRARPIVRALGKKVVTWQEAARAGLDPEDIAQYWLEFDPDQFREFDVDAIPEEVRLPDGSKLTPEVLAAIGETMAKSGGDVDKALAAGAKVIVSRGAHAYLDTPYGEPSAEPAQEAERARLGMPFYPNSTIEQFFGWDPAIVHPSLREEVVAGVEAAIWCESVESFSDLLFLLLPRLPGIGEKGWSRPEASAWPDYQPRLAAQAPFWRDRDWNFFQSSLVEWQ
jgi:hexosaminidase